MKLQQLKYLLAIVDNGLNITAAAERLYTSQPGVSKQLKLLEEELGLQVFVRKGKSLGGITAAGEQVIDRARLIMAEVENIRSLASDYFHEEEGMLSIATTHTQARYVLPDVIREFRERYPRVNLNLHQGSVDLVPVLRDAGHMSLADAERAIRDFAARAREGSITLEELQGGTFTITNAGAMGGGFFAPIINYPEVAILGLGQARMQPVVRDAGKGDFQIVPRLMMPIVLCIDHRVLDGADAIKFLRVIIDSLEDPDELLMSMV